jgi:hypothetical protein
MDIADIGKGFYRLTRAVFVGSLVAGSGLILYGLNNSDPDANKISQEGLQYAVLGFSVYLIGHLIRGTSNFPFFPASDDCSSDLEKRVQ